MRRPIFAAFDQGQIPNITCANLATVPLGVDFAKLVDALREFVENHFVPVWGAPCKLDISGDGKIPSGHWALLFFDDADTANALGYHDLTRDGLPISKVFVRTTIDDGELVSVTAAHELAEMLVDPGIQMGAEAPNGTWYAYETADAVEEETFDINGIKMSDFVYPSWFEGFRKPKSTKFDHLGRCDRPFKILKGGYMPVFKNGKWTQIFGSKQARKWFNKKHHPRTSRRGSQSAPKKSSKATVS